MSAMNLWNILFDPNTKAVSRCLKASDDTVPFIARMIGIDAYNMTPAEWTKVQAKLRELVKQCALCQRRHLRWRRVWHQESWSPR